MISGRSLYAGAAHGLVADGRRSLDHLRRPDAGRSAPGLLAAIATIEDGPAFQWANADHMTAFLAHLALRTGSYLSKVAGTEQGGSLAYLIAPGRRKPGGGIDAALKAANVELATYIPAPSETNYSGAFPLRRSGLPATRRARRSRRCFRFPANPLAW